MGDQHLPEVGVQHQLHNIHHKTCFCSPERVLQVNNSVLRERKLQASPQREREEPRQSSWESNNRSSSSSWSSQSSRSRSSSPHEERLRQQERIQAQRAAKPAGRRTDTSYYNSNKSSFGSSSQVCLTLNPSQASLYDSLPFFTVKCAHMSCSLTSMPPACLVQTSARIFSAKSTYTICKTCSFLAVF